jgi:outer membrane protein
MKQVVTVCVFALSLALASSTFAAGELKLGSVDVQKILNQSDAGKEATRKLDTKARKAVMEMASREKELNQLKTELEKQSVLLAEMERRTKETVYIQRLQEYQQFVEKANKDIQEEKAELTKRIVGDIIKVIQDYGRKKGYFLIVVKNDGMLYLDDKIDLTDEILQAFNAVGKSGPSFNGDDRVSLR